MSSLKVIRMVLRPVKHEYFTKIRYESITWIDEHVIHISEPTWVVLDFGECICQVFTLTGPFLHFFFLWCWGAVMGMTKVERFLITILIQTNRYPKRHYLFNWSTEITFTPALFKMLPFAKGRLINKVKIVLPLGFLHLNTK